MVVSNLGDSVSSIRNSVSGVSDPVPDPGNQLPVLEIQFLMLQNGNQRKAIRFLALEIRSLALEIQFVMLIPATMGCLTETRRQKCVRLKTVPLD